MGLKDYPFGYPRYMLFRDDDGFYLATSAGDIATREDVEYIARELVDYARRFEKDIIIHNLRNEIEFNERLYGIGNGDTKKELPKKRRVYLMKCDKYYKVGVSTCPEARLDQLNNKPFPTELIAQSDMVHCAFDAERDLHSYLERYKVGGEWFDIPDEMVDIVANNVRNIDATDDVIFGYEEA